MSTNSKLSNDETNNSENSFEKAMGKIIQTNHTKTSSETLSNGTISIRETLIQYANSQTMKMKNSPLEYWKLRSDMTEKPCFVMKI